MSAREVVCVDRDGSRVPFRSVAQAGRQVQASKDDIRKAIKKATSVKGRWFKYHGERDPANFPPVPEPGIGFWSAMCVPLIDDQQEITVYCKELADRPITSIKINSGQVNCSQILAAAGTFWNTLLIPYAQKQSTEF